MMSRFAMIGAVLCCVVVGQVFAGEAYVSKEGKYMVRFSKQPKEVTQEAPLPTGQKIKVYLTVAEISTDKAQLGSYADYPPELVKQPAQTILMNVRDGTKGPNGVISEDKEITHGKDKVPGRDYILFKAGFYQHFRSYLKGNRLYQVAYVGKSKEEVKGPEALRFLDSFEITK